MHWPAELACAEAPRSRYHMCYLGGYVRRGLANPQARRLKATIDEVQVERDIAIEEAARKKRSYRRTVVA
jgi:hypothetical protein